MALADEIDRLAQRALVQLNRVHNFYRHTGIVWDTFQRWVGAGNAIQFQNPMTGDAVTEGDLLRLASGYQADFVLTLTFQHLTSIFEVFFFDLLRLILADDPRRLAQKKQIEFGQVLAASDVPSLVQLLIDVELNEVKYKKPREWFKYLDKFVHLDGPTDDEIAAVAELKATRDVLAHNAGVANAIYIDKAGAKSRFRAGELVAVTPPYHDDAWRLVRKLVADLSDGVLAKLVPP